MGRGEGREIEREWKNDGERKFLVSSHKTLITLWGPHVTISSKPMHVPPPKPHLIMKQRTKLTPCWSYCFSSNLCALLPGLTPAGSAPWKGMPPTAWNTHHSSFLGLWLPGLIITDITIFIHIEIIFLFWRFIGIWWRDLEWTRPKDIPFPLGSDQHQKVCNNQPHALLFFIKDWILTQIRWFFGTPVMWWAVWAWTR